MWGLLLFLMSSEAFSQERTLSLREAVDQAMTGNLQLRASDRGLSASREEIGIAGSYLLPRLNFEERVMRTNNPTYAFMAKLNQERFSAADLGGAPETFNHPDTITDFQTGLSFEQTLFAPKVSVGIDMAKTEYSARGDDFERKKEEVAFDVFRTFIGIQTAREYISVTEKAVEDAGEHLRIAAARYDSELGLYSDMLRARAAMSAAEEKNISARKELDVAKRALGLLLGLSDTVDVKGERPDLSVRELDYYQIAAVSRKDLKALEIRYRNAENALRMAKAAYLPVAGLGGGYQMNSHSAPLGEEGNSWQVTAFLKWELFDGTKREHERARAGYQIAETGQYLEGLKKQISFEIYRAYRTVEEAHKGLELAQKTLEASEEGRRLVMKRYENSLSPMVDLLDVQSNLDLARARVVEKEGLYLTAIANLWFQSGTLLRDLEIGQ